MQKAYNRTYWENKPSDKSPINERNLNKIEAGVDTIDDRVISLDTTKFDKADAQGLIRSLTFNRANGVFTITYVNGATATIDTMLEKLAVNFDFDENAQQLIIALDDGTEKRVDLSAFIVPLEFLESDTVSWQLQTDGKVRAIIKEGSIEEKHLQPNYLADIKVETAKAEASKNAAAASEANAAESEKKAKEAEANAALSEADAEKYKTDAETAAQNAKASENASKTSETNAALSEAAAKASENAAGLSEQAAADSAADAGDSAGMAEDFAKMSKSYAIGTDGESRPDDAADNSKFYSDLAKKLTDEAQKLLEQAQKIIAAASTGALIPAGTISFEDLPSEPQVGYMYNISNDFTTDSRFTEGAGIFYRAGANIYWTKDGQWDVMVGTQVTGVKGDGEAEYRIGNVNLTKANIGLGNVDNTADASKDVNSSKIVKDIGNNRDITFAYSKDALGSATWLAAWNGYELRGIPPSNVDVRSAKDADTVDGIHASGFMRHFGDYGVHVFGTYDLNDWQTPGCYASQAGCSNVPQYSDGWGTIFIFESLGGVVQIFFSWNDSYKRLGFRACWGGWSEWRELIDSSSISDQSVGYADTAGSATKALQDGNGSVIADTYIKKLDTVYKYASGEDISNVKDKVYLDYGHTYLVIVKSNSYKTNADEVGGAIYIITCPRKNVLPTRPAKYEIAGHTSIATYVSISIQPGNENGRFYMYIGATKSTYKMDYSIYDMS